MIRSRVCCFYLLLESTFFNSPLWRCSRQSKGSLTTPKRGILTGCSKHGSYTDWLPTGERLSRRGDPNLGSCSPDIRISHQIIRHITRHIHPKLHRYTLPYSCFDRFSHSYYSLVVTVSLPPFPFITTYQYTYHLSGQGVATISPGLLVHSIISRRLASKFQHGRRRQINHGMFGMVRDRGPPICPRTSL